MFLPVLLSLIGPAIDKGEEIESFNDKKLFYLINKK